MKKKRYFGSTFLASQSQTCVLPTSTATRSFMARTRPPHNIHPTQSANLGVGEALRRNSCKIAQSSVWGSFLPVIVTLCVFRKTSGFPGHAVFSLWITTARLPILSWAPFTLYFLYPRGIPLRSRCPAQASFRLAVTKYQAGNSCHKWMGFA